MEPNSVMLTSPRSSGEEDSRLIDYEKSSADLYGKISARRAMMEKTLQQVLPENITGQCKMKMKRADGGLLEDGWDEKDGQVGTKSDLDENAYGAAAVALVRDTTNLIDLYRNGFPTALTWTRLGTSLGVMLVNLVMQGLLLYFINELVVLPSIHKVQVIYRDFHANVFDDDGNLIQAVWDDYEDKSEVCGITMANRTFYYVILSLWAGVCLQEVRTIYRIVRSVWNLEACTNSIDMVTYVDTEEPMLGGTCLITKLTQSMRWVLLLTVCLPRVVISLYLYQLGLSWLTASTSFTEMVLNAIALGFVKDIDELLYNSILPLAFQKQIAETDIFFRQKPKTRQDVDKDEWVAFNRTMIFVVAFAVTVVLYGECLQRVLPSDLSQLRAICADYLAEKQIPICNEIGFMGWSQKCFPYGKSYADL